MKIESLSLDKFKQHQLTKDALKNVVGGKVTCTGGGFHLYSQQADSTGMQYVYETWDSDLHDSETNKDYGHCNYKDNVLGACFDDDYKGGIDMM